MEELIDLNDKFSSVKYNDIIEEILIHSRFAKNLVDRFVERDDVLKLVISTLFACLKVLLLVYCLA
jgi:hypothetical protein